MKNDPRFHYMCGECYTTMPDSVYHCINCGGRDLFNIDTAFMEVIQILNRKGYRTAFCCGGRRSPKHIKTEKAYITFKFDLTVDLNIFKSLPNDWKMEFMPEWDRRDNTTYIISDRRKIVLRDMGTELDYIKSIRQWVDSLPDIIEKEVES